MPDIVLRVFHAILFNSHKPYKGLHIRKCRLRELKEIAQDIQLGVLFKRQNFKIGLFNCKVFALSHKYYTATHIVEKVNFKTQDFDF